MLSSFGGRAVNKAVLSGIKFEVLRRFNAMNGDASGARSWSTSLREICKSPVVIHRTASSPVLLGREVAKALA